MKYLSLLFMVFFLLQACSRPVPQKEDYLGVYRIISVNDGGEKFNPGLSQIELTPDSYIYRIDNNNDNRFSQDEILKSTYDFNVEEAEKPYLKISGNPDKIYLLPDNHYDLLFKYEGDKQTVFSTKYARIQRKAGPKNFYGTYDLIKIRENGKILNIAHNARIIITEFEYISELDLDRNGSIDEKESNSVSYSLIKGEDDIWGMKINNSDIPVWLVKEETFNLLLLKIDEFGNETVMYLKK